MGVVCDYRGDVRVGDTIRVMCPYFCYCFVDLFSLELAGSQPQWFSVISLSVSQKPDFCLPRQLL
jgi:hypothetical protein